MAVECSQRIFEILLSVVPGETGNDEVVAFAYEHIDSIDFLNAEAPVLPDLRPTTLENWSAVKHWLSRIELDVDMELEYILKPWFDYDEPDAPTPIEFFKSAHEFLATVTQNIERMLDESGEFEFGCLEVTHGDRQFFLYYSSANAWALGHGNSVRVADATATGG